jgi:hypothetical protein
MDQMMGGGEGGLGGQAGFPLETWFWEMPFCTRWWTTATVLTSALVQCQIVTPFQLFYSFRAVFVKSQVSSHDVHLIQYVCQADSYLVLAPSHDVPLLWTFESRPRFPRLLSTTLLPSSRGVIWPLARSLLLAPALCNSLSHLPLPPCIDALSWAPSFFHTGIYMVKA